MTAKNIFFHLSAFSEPYVPPMMSILPDEHNIDDGDSHGNILVIIV